MTPEDVIDQATAPLIAEINALKDEGRFGNALEMARENARAAIESRDRLLEQNQQLERDVKRVLRLLINRIALTAMGQIKPTKEERDEIQDFMDDYDDDA